LASLFTLAGTAAELDLPHCALMHPATAAESLHCTKTFMIQRNSGLLAWQTRLVQNFLAGFLHVRAAFRAEPELVHTTPYKVV